MTGVLGLCHKGAQVFAVLLVVFSTPALCSSSSSLLYKLVFGTEWKLACRSVRVGAEAVWQKVSIQTLPRTFSSNSPCDEETASSQPMRQVPAVRTPERKSQAQAASDRIAEYECFNTEVHRCRVASATRRLFAGQRLL